MEHYLGIFVRAVFIENMALTFFLGMCTFIAISKRFQPQLALGWQWWWFWRLLFRSTTLSLIPSCAKVLMAGLASLKLI